MRLSEYRSLHKNLNVVICKHFETNNVPSATDPTQDIPVRMIQMTASGVPLNVKQRDLKFNNLKIENLTTIEKRNNDVFDCVGELQENASKFNRKGISITKQIKQN